MGFLDELRVAPARDERSEKINPRHPRDPALAALFSNPDDPHVGPETALRITAVYACVSLIAETIASLPLHVYLRGANGETSKSKSHPLYEIVHDSPSRRYDLTSFEWRESMVSHTALRGDAYARISYNSRGQIDAIDPIHPDHIRPRYDERRRVVYMWQEDGQGRERALFSEQVLRIPFKMMDFYTSLSPIGVHRRTLTNTINANRMLAAAYKNGVRPGGAITHDEPLNEEARARIRASIEALHAGPDNAGRFLVLDGGFKFSPMEMKLADFQFIEQQNFSVTDIARIYLVPPHKIGDLSRATFSNIEEQSLDFVASTMLRWCRRIESRMNRSLLSDEDRRAGYYIAFDLRGLMRGNAQARASFYQALFYLGAITPNEIRAAEDLNPYENGDQFFLQGATVPIDAAGNTPLAAAQAARRIPAAQASAARASAVDRLDDLIQSCVSRHAGEAAGEAE